MKDGRTTSRDLDVCRAKKLVQGGGGIVGTFKMGEGGGFK